MNQIITSRRKFITGLSALIAAPAIVKASSLMPVKVIEPTISLMPPGLYRGPIKLIMGKPYHQGDIVSDTQGGYWMCIDVQEAYNGKDWVKLSDGQPLNTLLRPL